MSTPVMTAKTVQWMLRHRQQLRTFFVALSPKVEPPISPVRQFHSWTNHPNNELVPKEYSFVQLRFRYKSRGDPRFYYAPLGKMIDTSVEAKPFKPPQRKRQFPSFEEAKEMDLRQLKREMKPKTRGRNAFKRRWKRWLESMRDKRQHVKRMELLTKSKAKKVREKEERSKQLRLEWDRKQQNLATGK